jgi:signal transduction histidine kinase/CheY-like chemotaxis protein
MVRTLVHNALLDGTIKIPEKLIKGKTNQTYEIISLSNEIGSIYKFEITHTIIKGKGTPTAIIGMARDVTKYYALEQSYISKLEKANTNKTAFLGRLSHDMRTPLGAIAALSNFGLEEVKDEKALLYFSKIKDNSEYLLSFITDVLESRKIGEKALPFQPEVFVPATLFNQIISIIQLRAVDKDIQLELEACNSFDKYILFNDITKIKKVGINLLSNAIKYTPRGGKVKVKVSSEIISENYLKITCIISDNGVGMSKDFQEHMYDEFSQEHNRLSFEEEGTGLGLSIVKRIIKLIDGTISCESELNKGTTFTVTFNSRFATEEQIEELHKNLNISNLDKLRNKKILICEDKKINIMIESKLLNDSGVLVDVAQNGQIGVQKALENKYDAILMDVRMPVMDGLKATIEIRKKDTDIPIIALSANATQEDKIKSIEAGMNAHISKPINKDELYRVLYKYIE